MSGPNSLLSRLDSVLAEKRTAPRWWVAFSGGPDSTVLLHLIHQWCAAHPEQAPALWAIHVDHGIQSEAADWSSHCRTQCEQWHIPLIVKEARVSLVGRGLEAAAREARYGVFEAHMGKGDTLFMGHHLDDQVETYFLRLLRGSGLQGLSAMPANRPLGHGELCRPLLDITRQQLQEYAAGHELRTVEDPSNADASLDRNYLRLEVLPRLAERWPGYRQTVARAAEHAATSAGLADEYLPPVKTVYSVLGDPGVAIKALDLGRPNISLLLLRRWLRSGGYTMPDQSLLVEFLRQLRDGGNTASPRMECAEYAVERYQSHVYLLPQFALQSACEGALHQLSIGTGESIVIEGVGTLGLVPCSAGQGLRLDSGDSLHLRWRRGGERCRIVGSPYQQRLKKLFQERSIPPWWRARVPLLYLGDELLAVGDLWLCESSRLADAQVGKADLLQLQWQRKPAAFD